MHAHVIHVCLFSRMDSIFSLNVGILPTCKHILLTIDADCELSVLHSSKMHLYHGILCFFNAIYTTEKTHKKPLFFDNSVFGVSCAHTPLVAAQNELVT